MKPTFTLTLAGLACALVTSCSIPTKDTVYVTTKSGAPICGAQVLPSQVALGCANPILTGPCGEAKLPTDAVYSVQKQGYRTVYGLKRCASGPKHVVMDVGWPQ